MLLSAEGERQHRLSHVSSRASARRPRIDPPRQSCDGVPAEPTKPLRVCVGRRVPPPRQKKMARALPPSRFALRSDPVAVANPKMSVLFCHAAGFCAEVWRPVIDELSALARQPPGAPELVMSAIDLPGTTWLGRTLALALTLTLSLTLSLTGARPARPRPGGCGGAGAATHARAVLRRRAARGLWRLRLLRLLRLLAHRCGPQPGRRVTTPQP